MKKNTMLTLIAGALALGACGSDDVRGDSVSLSFEGLPALGDGYVYEGWVIVDDAPVSTGRFTVDEEGALSVSRFEVDATEAAMFVLTIEPAVGDEPGPTDVHVVAGPFVDGIADLSIGHPAALGTDFADATGEFVLATPSSEAEDDYDQGIWWVVPGDAPSPGLRLPTLPEGWTYEGWIVGPGGPVSTGTFLEGGMGDDDAGGPAAGPGMTPPFPGQDFITPATVLSSMHMAVISVEPVPDDSAAPFQIKPLFGSIADVMPPTTQPMDNRVSEHGIGGTAVLD